MRHPGIAILDFGSQYTQTIARRFRQLHAFSEILEPEIPTTELANASGIVLSGGPASVYQPGAPKCSDDVFSLGKPESATVIYVLLDDMNLLVQTNNTYRKWKNLQENKNVSVVVGFQFGHLYLQYDGIAELIERGHRDYKKSDGQFLAENPTSEKLCVLPENVYVRIKPAWIRLRDDRTNPPVIEELVIK